MSRVNSNTVTTFPDSGKSSGHRAIFFSMKIEGLEREQFIADVVQVLTGTRLFR